MRCVWVEKKLWIDNLTGTEIKREGVSPNIQKTVGNYVPDRTFPMRKTFPLSYNRHLLGKINNKPPPPPTILYMAYNISYACIYYIIGKNRIQVFDHHTFLCIIRFTFSFILFSLFPTYSHVSTVRLY